MFKVAKRDQCGQECSRVTKSAQGGQECSRRDQEYSRWPGRIKVARGGIKVARRDQVARCD